MRWLSVPPDTSRRPWPASASASADGVAHDLGGVVLELGRGRLGERHRLGRDHVVERAALQAGEHRLVDRLGELGACRGSRRRAGPAASCGW